MAVLYKSGRIFVAKYEGALNSKKLEGVLTSLNSQVRKAFPNKKRLPKMLVHQDNDPVQNSKATAQTWLNLGWHNINVKLEPTKKGRPKFMPAYSPDLSPMDSCLFGNFHRELERKLQSKLPTTKKTHDAMAIKTMKLKKSAEATKRFVENFRERYRKVIEGKGEMVQ